MRGWLKICNTVYWLALTTWVGVLVAAAVAAFATFTVLPRIGLNLEAFEAIPAEEHGRVAAGKVMEPIFTFVDVMQVVAGTLVIATAALQCWPLRVPWRRPMNAIRLVALALAAGLFVFRAATLTPQMNRDLRAYWAAAEAGDVETARRHREAFGVAHPRASDLFSATLAMLVIAVASSPAALASPPRSSTAPTEGSAT